jgi:hypothetical protein
MISVLLFPTVKRFHSRTLNPALWLPTLRFRNLLQVWEDFIFLLSNFYTQMEFCSQKSVLYRSCARTSNIAIKCEAFASRWGKVMLGCRRAGSKDEGNNFVLILSFTSLKAVRCPMVIKQLVLMLIFKRIQANTFPSHQPMHWHLSAYSWCTTTAILSSWRGEFVTSDCPCL